MSSEENSIFLAVKEEMCNGSEDHDSNLIQKFFQISTISSLDNTEVQIKKEEPDDENEELNYYEDIEVDDPDSENIDDGYTINSYDLFQNSFNDLSENNQNYFIQLESSPSIKIVSENDSENVTLDQIVKIKEEDEFEFRIVELKSLDVDSNQLESVMEFEDEQKTSFRIEDLQNYEVLQPSEESYSTIKQETNDDDPLLNKSSNILLYSSIDSLPQTSGSSTSPTKQAMSSRFFEKNLIQKKIIEDTSKMFNKTMKFSKLCSDKFANLSDMLQRSSLNEKFLSRILLKNPSYSPPKQIINKMHIISKSIRLDKTYLQELPNDIMEKFNLRKYSVNFEKKEGQLINMVNIPYYVCTSCSTIFATRNNFFIHYKTLHATVEKPFDCWKCVISYCTWEELLNHLKCHDENRQLNCKYCFYKFKLRKSLENHIKTVHNEKVGNISCEICGRNFDSERVMLIHKKRHAVGTINGKSPHAIQRINSIKCIFCPAQFFKSELLEEHYKTHKKLEKMKCRSCSKEVLVNPQYIINNIKMKEFKCINCITSKFTGNSSSDIDLTSKNVEKSKKAKIKKVIAMNTNQDAKKMAVKCYICGIEVGSNIKLFWHCKKHLERNEFKCSVCREDFDSRESMIEHCKAEHQTPNIHLTWINEDILKTSSPQASSFLPKMNEINSKKSLTSINDSNQAVKPSKIIKQDNSELKTEVAEVTTYHKCSICNEHVLDKDRMIHNQRHFQERISKLAKSIRNRAEIILKR